MTPEPPDLPPPSVPVTDALAADAAGAHATHAPVHAHSAGNSHCLNCGTKLTGPFCSACGQHDFDFHRSFRHVFMEALENIFHFDGKFFQNLVTLLFRPGRLTAEFNAGKRAAQVPPFRLYIFTAFIFFLLLLSTSDRRSPAVHIDPTRGSTTASAPSGSIQDAIAEIRHEIAAKEAARANATATDANDDASATPKPARDFGKAAAARSHVGERDAVEGWLEHQGKRAMDPAFQQEMGHRFVAALPKMLLFCVPVFALFTRVLFRRSGQVYLQHLVLALHFHTFIYIFILFRDGWTFLISLTGLTSVSALLGFVGNTWLAIYPALMLRRLFANSWGKTLVKTFLLALSYGIFLVFAFVATAMVLFLMM